MIRGGIIMNFIIGMINNLTSKKFPPFFYFSQEFHARSLRFSWQGSLNERSKGPRYILEDRAMSNAAHWVCKGRPHIHSGLEIKGKIRIKYVKLLYLYLLFKNQMEKFITKVVFISEPTLKQIFN